MKNQIDSYMREASLDALVITGSAYHNPAMVYWCGVNHLSEADVIKVYGQDPVLFYLDMERDEARKTGLQSKPYSKYAWADFMRQTGGDIVRATALRYGEILTEFGLQTSRIAFYGNFDIGMGFDLLNQIKAILPDLIIHRVQDNDVIQKAMIIKDEDEIKRVRRVGQATSRVVDKVASYLTGCRTKENMLVHKDGNPVRIGEVKKKIKIWLIEEGVEEFEPTIFSIGKDAAVPHSIGNPDDCIGLGKTIVFDIFPCEAGGGYFYDFTRTWCLGYAPQEVVDVYTDVKRVFSELIDLNCAGVNFAEIQKLACEKFESMGYPTVRSKPGTHEGYVHGIGHGVGLHLHEKPISGQRGTEEEIILPGSVITVEPGLYFPAKEFGVRIEDTFLVKPDGRLLPLAEYQYDLILPMNPV